MLGAGLGRSIALLSASPGKGAQQEEQGHDISTNRFFFENVFELRPQSSRPFGHVEASSAIGALATPSGRHHGEQLFGDVDGSIESRVKHNPTVF